MTKKYRCVRSFYMDTLNEERAFTKGKEYRAEMVDSSKYCYKFTSDNSPNHYLDSSDVTEYFIEIKNI